MSSARQTPKALLAVPLLRRSDLHFRHQVLPVRQLINTQLRAQRRAHFLGLIRSKRCNLERERPHGLLVGFRRPRPQIHVGRQICNLRSRVVYHHEPHLRLLVRFPRQTHTTHPALLPLPPPFVTPPPL